MAFPDGTRSWRQRQVIPRSVRRSPCENKLGVAESILLQILRGSSEYQVKQVRKILVQHKLTEGAE